MRTLKPIIPLKDLVVGKTYLEHVPDESDDSMYDLFQSTIIAIDEKLIVVYLNGLWPITQENMKLLQSFTPEQIMNGDWELPNLDTDYFDEAVILYRLDQEGIEIYNDYVGEIQFMALDENEEIIYKTECNELP